MDLDISQIIRRPVLSDKAYKLNKQQNKLVLHVHPKANKPLIADALRKLFDVVASKIRISIRKGKNRRVRGRGIRTSPLEKKAFVTLKEGYTLDLFGHAQYEAKARTNLRVNDSNKFLTK